MATSQFFPASVAGWIDGRPNTPVQFTDLNVNNFLLVLAKTWVNPDTGANVEVFQIEVLEGGGSNVQLHRTTYLFPTYNCSIAQFKTLLNSLTPGIATVGTAVVQSNNLVSYTNLFAIDEVDKTLTTRNVLVNDDRVVRRTYNIAGDYTTLYLNAGNELAYKKLFVSGDQEKAFAYYYAY